jgi:hypothetical protein
MRASTVEKGAASNDALRMMRERTALRWDAGGPLDGWDLSPEDLALFAARHRAIQGAGPKPQSAPSRLVGPGARRQ